MDRITKVFKIKVRFEGNLLFIKQKKERTLIGNDKNDVYSSYDTIVLDRMDTERLIRSLKMMIKKYSENLD